MRVPTDMPKRRRGTGRGRIIVIVVIAVAFLLIIVPAGPRRLLDRLPVVRLARSVVGVLRHPAGQARPRRDLHRGVLRADLRQPHRRRPPGAEEPSARSRGRPAQPLPRGRRPAGDARARRGVARARPHRRRRDVERVEPVDPVHQRRRLRDQGPDVPDRHRLLRLQAALLHDDRELAVRLGRDHPARHDRRPLPERRHPAAVAGAAGDPAGEGPPLGDPRPARPGEGGRLLAAALRPHLVDPGHRRRRHLHRREGPAAGDLPAAVHRPAVVRAVHLQHLASGLGAARSWPSACGRWSRWWPAWPTRRSSSGSGWSPRSPPRRRRTSSTTSRRRATRSVLDDVEIKAFDYNADRRRHHQGHRRQPGHHPQRPPARPVDRDAHLPAPAEPLLASTSSPSSTSTATRWPPPIPTKPGTNLKAETTQVVLGARDLSTSGIPQQSWEGSHLAYTHGYGVALAAANTTNDDRRPGLPRAETCRST